MADYRAQARRAAVRAGLDPDIFERQIQQESGFNPHARSGAGALGIAQIMPDTAKGWGVDPLNPTAALNAAARNMRRYVDQFGSYRNALVAYNAGPGRVGKPLYRETADYVKTILGGKNPGSPTSPAASEASEASEAAQLAPQLPPLKLPERPRVQATTPTAPVFAAKPVMAGAPQAGAASALQALGREAPERFDVRKALAALQPTQAQTLPSPASETSQTTSRSAKTGKLTPGGDWGGTTKPLTALATLAQGYGLVTSSAKRDKQLTASGNTSDHWSGNKTANARDLAGSVGQMDNAAVALAKRLGIVDYKKGQKLEATITRDGIRWQVLYRTNTGGNHFDHIHVGAKRV